MPGFRTTRARSGAHCGCSAFRPAARAQPSIANGSRCSGLRSKSARSSFPADWRAARNVLLSSLPELVERAAGALGDELSGRFAFFGYSMGSLVAFELARLLRRERGIEPEWLFVAAHSAPQLARRAPAMSDAPDDELLQFFQRTYGPLPPQVTAHPELLAVISDILRADVHLLERYAYAAEPPLGCPIRAFGGLGDASTLRAELEAWHAHTAADFALQMFSGGHFFWEQSLVELVQVVGRLPAVSPGSTRAGRGCAADMLYSAEQFASHHPRR